MEKKNLKVCVYAISKNEAKFVKRWCDSMKEADKIVVLDTGSSDDTVKLLKENGAFVTIKEIKPWRFDVARNESLKLVDEDTDICVCTDLDEVFIRISLQSSEFFLSRGKGKLETEWKKRRSILMKLL